MGAPPGPRTRNPPVPGSIPPMPTYEYRCRDCGREFEVFQRMSDKPGAPCPDCGFGAERLISGGAGFLFKGDGFYITDHRSDDYRKKAREEAGIAAGKASDSDPSGGKARSSSSSEASGPPGKGDGKAAAATGALDGGTASQGG